MSEAITDQTLEELALVLRLAGIAQMRSGH